MQSWIQLNAHGQWARPFLCAFILKELNAVECEGLACETRVTVQCPSVSFQIGRLEAIRSKEGWIFITNLSKF